MNRPTKTMLRFVLICYALALVVYLAVCSVSFGLDSLRAGQGRLAPVNLGVENFTLDAFEKRQTSEYYVTIHDDPQLIYQPGHEFYATGFVFNGEAVNKPGGEMVLYYQTPRDGGFSERHKLWARQQPDGGWYFDLKGRAYTALRFDIGAQPGVLWRVEGFALLGAKNPLDYYLPDALDAAALLVLPGFGAAALLEGETVARLRQIRRRITGRARR